MYPPDGYVSSIQYVAQAGPFPNQVQVYGRAQSTSGHIALQFVDTTGTSYSLSIISETPSTHTLDIYGGAVTIATINWSVG